MRYVGYGIPTELFGPFVTACFTCGRGDLSRALRFSTDLSSFDSFANMFANTFKLQDECDIIALRIAKC